MACDKIRELASLKNASFDIDEEKDEHNTVIRCIENKIADKNGRYRKTKKLMEHNTKWLWRMLEEKGFIRKSKFED